MTSIKVKLVTEKGDTVLREDGTLMIFILVDEAVLRHKIKFHREHPITGSNLLIETLKKILGDKE